MVGEGANLGMTQRARIAYGLKGGRCNSDAIDNSAGVNTSDVEVNIKIALAPATRDGRLSTDDRLALLREMTDDVAELVLRNNYQQTLAISIEERHGLANLAHQLRLIGELEARGLLDRGVEALPSDAELEARAAAGKGLTRAEIGTLLAYAKIALSADLVGGPVPDDPYLARELVRYFPDADARALRRRHRDASPAPRDHRDAARQLADQSRRPDAARRGARPHRRLRRRPDARLRGGARQPFAARAARRDRGARRHALRAGCSSSSSPSCRTCWSTASAGSPATSIPAKGLAEIVAHHQRRL